MRWKYDSQTFTTEFILGKQWVECNCIWQKKDTTNKIVLPISGNVHAQFINYTSIGHEKMIMMILHNRKFDKKPTRSDNTNTVKHC